MRRPLVVLWLAGEEAPAFRSLLARLGARLVGPAEYANDGTATHLVTMGPQDFEALADAFSAEQSDLRLVSLSPVANLPAFLRANGRLVLDAAWAEGPMGLAALEKFFLGKASLHLDENFPAVKEHGGFKVTNHLRTGHDMDRLAQFVHGRRADVVDVRTFVDHALYYFCYLLQAGSGFAPFEVEYAHTGSETLVQMHLPVRGFVAEHVVDAFGLPGGSPVGHLLGVCARSADFMEVHHIPSIGRLVITGMWRDSRGEGAFGGLMLNQVLTSGQVRRAIASGELRTLEPGAEAVRADELAHTPLPGHLPGPVAPPSPKGGYLEDKPALARRMVLYAVDCWAQQAPGQSPSVITGPALRAITSGFPEPREVARLEEVDHDYLLAAVKLESGAAAREEVRTLAGGEAVDDPYSQILGGGISDDESVQSISGGPGEDPFNQVVGGGAGNGPFTQSIGGGSGEDPFAQTVGGGPGEDSFSQTVGGGVAEGPFSQTVGGGPGEDPFSQKVAGGPEEEKDRTKQVFGGEKTQEDDFTARFNSSGASSPKGDWKVSSSQGVSPQDQAMRGRVGGAPQAAANPFGAVNAVAPTAQLEAELQKTKSQLAIAMTELRSRREAQSQMDAVSAQTAEALAGMNADVGMGSQDRELRKLKLEMQQKDIFFMQELEKNQRAMKSRDLVVEKTKESVKLLVEKQNKQIHDLNARLATATALQSSAQQVFQQVKVLEQEKQSLSRQNEANKTKIASMSSLLEKQVAGSGGKKDEEFRKLQMEKQRVEVLMQTQAKDLQKAKTRTEVDSAEIRRLQGEISKLQEKIRTMPTNSAPVSIKSSAVEESQAQRIKELEKEVQGHTQKSAKGDQQVKELEQKIAELTAMLAKGGGNQADQALKSKTTQLETSIKKLTQDLGAANNQVAESKKEVNKLRSEKIALQNQLDKLKKEAEKGKPKDPKKAA